MITRYFQSKLRSWIITNTYVEFFHSIIKILPPCFPQDERSEPILDSRYCPSNPPCLYLSLWGGLRPRETHPAPLSILNQIICSMGTGDPFLESPETLRAIFYSGVTIPFVSQKRRGFKTSNFTVIFLFVTLKTCSKLGFPKQTVGSFTNGFSGPKSYRDFRETSPSSP